MNTFRRILLTSSLAISACSLAGATTISTGPFTVPVSPTSDAVNWTSSVSASKFDTTLGTLNDIRIYISGTSTATGSAIADAATNYTYTSNTSLSIKDADGHTSGVTLPNFTVNFPSQAIGSTMTVTGPGNTASKASWAQYTSTGALDFGSTISLNSGDTSNLGSLSSSINIGTYAAAGGGSILFTSFGNQNDSFSGGPFHAASASGTADATVTIYYDYTASTTNVNQTPEPATFALFGGALLGIGLLRKSRQN